MDRLRVDESIWELHKASKTIRYIMKTLKVGQARVYDVINCKKNGTQRDPQPHIGRPNILNPHVLGIIEFYTLLNAKLTNKELKKILQENHSITLGKTTINKARHILLFNFKPPKIKQKLSQEQINIRFHFLQYFKQNPDLFFNLVFSDESRFCQESDNRWVWRRRNEWNESSYAEKSKFKQSIMVWGAISKEYKSPLIIFDENINSKSYLKYLKESSFFNEVNNLYGSRNWMFIQDGASSHTADETIRELYDICNVLPFWPPNSCDLNPIEMLWGAMKRILKNKEIKDKKELEEVLHILWDSIPLERIDSLCSSFNSRMVVLEQVGCCSIQPYLSSNVLDVARIPGREPPQVQPWTSMEEERLLKEWGRVGNKWKHLSLLFPDRTRGELKHRTNLLLRGKKLRFLVQPFPALSDQEPQNLEVFLSTVGN